MITIDRVTRQMKIPDKEKILGVVSDEDSHTLYFTCASILDQNFDLTTANIYINYRRSDGEIGQYMVTDKSVMNGSCTFSWLVSRAAYAQKGTVDFIVCMKIVDEDGIVQKEWNTTLGHLTVLEGIEPEGEIPIPPADTDLISQLVNYVKSTVDQAEADINSTKTSAIEALDQKEIEISDAIDDKIADLNTLGVVRPNLLINSDFKSGIINQRGNEEYNLGTGNTGNKPTIDRWIGNCTYVKPYDGYLYIKDNIDTSKAYLYQNLSSVCNGDYTVYINISSMSGGTLNLYFDGELSNKFTISEQGEHIYTFEGVSNQNKFTLELDGFEGNIECIKLEKGSVFTGMPNWDVTTELLKCQRYLYILGTGWANQYPARSDASVHRIAIRTPILMANNPSLVRIGGSGSLGLVTLNGTVNNTASVSLDSATLQNLNPFIIIDVPIGTSNQIGYGNAVFNATLALDAETY